VIQREFEDVAALIDSISEKVFLLGHSYGALCSLEAALLTTNISKLALYEPPMYTTIEISYPADAPDRFLAYLRAGEPEKAILILYEIGGMSTAELNLLKSLPSWQARILAAHTIPREVISVRYYSFDPSRFKNLKTSVLFC
jgi:pimeloyl-ACP methyl ester carboxylesterase